MSERAVWGCLECGALSETLSGQRRCPVCGDGLVTELGGAPNPQKAQALIAWARRDATAQIEGRGTIAGGAAGAAVAVTAGWAFASGGAALLVLLAYAALLGGLIGHAAALPIHRRLRPHSRLQPVIDPAAQRRMRWLIGGVGGLGLVAAAAFGAAGGDGQAFRLLLGKVWALFGG